MEKLWKTETNPINQNGSNTELMTKINQKNEKDNNFIIVSIVVSLIIIGLWLLTWYLLKDEVDTKRGTFGDMFGSVNALFSGLALAGIILTILLQRKELKLQREELRDTRLEFQTQNETLKLQRFENTFFNLLNIHHQIVNAMDFTYSTGKGQISRRFEDKELVTINGRDVFRFKFNKMHPELVAKPDTYQVVYMKHYKDSITDFGHYFRNLYRMIKLVDETKFYYNSDDISKEEIFAIKYNYTSMIRAQTSDYELLWLFYNCLSENGQEKFKPLIEKYSFFKNIPSTLLTSPTHIAFYSQQAYTPMHKK